MLHLISLLLVGFTFVELNCENLFDTEKDSVKNDAEYTADSFLHWNNRKYYDKLNKIGKEIMSCTAVPGSKEDGAVPDMIALCEVENDSVMVGLTRKTMLWSFHYEYLITHSPDRRGINTALMYNPDAFKLLATESVTVTLPDNHPTRDILYAKGVLQNLDTLHVFVVHSPSRRGGEAASRKNRMAVAEELCRQIEKIGVGQRHHIIAAGDFNDYSDDPALTYIGQHGMTEISRNATGIYDPKHKGTYFFNGEWNSLDHIFVSHGMLPWLKDCHINDFPALLERNNYGELVPRRSIKGYRYNGGFSDHLPLVSNFEIVVK